jgi:protoporphyrinogen oxidase
MSLRVVVVGGGIGGTSAALRLGEAGARVTLLEASDRLGGLVTSFEVAGVPLERAYHYLVPGEPDILALLGELGLSDRVAWFPSRVAILLGGRVWPFTTPLDLLRFGPLPVADRIRTGLGALRLSRVREWEPLDEEPALDWLARLTSPRAAEVVWAPMLRAKFGPAAGDVPAAWMWARLRQRARARRRGGEVLGYLRGGFARMFEALAARLSSLGAAVRLGARVERIALDGDRAVGVEVAGEALEADAVLYAGTLPGLARLVPEERRDPRWTEARGLGVMLAVLETDRPVTDAFWVNVCDPLPFGGIIEHTNLVPPGDYGGTHVTYLSRYFLPEEPVASADPEREAAAWVAALADAVPGFSPARVRALHAFRVPYAAPVVGLGYRTRIPPVASHLEGLYVATTAQIYPEDRGMSEGVRLGHAAARAILARVPAARPRT